MTVHVIVKLMATFAFVPAATMAKTVKKVSVLSIKYYVTIIRKRQGKPT